MKIAADITPHKNESFQQVGYVRSHKGFTLIEITMVLVIIGAIVGGILVGIDLVKGAEIRSEIAQVEKFDSAVNAFKNKYNGIPGDLSSNLASQFGFVARAGTRGRGDGDGIVEGVSYGNGNYYGWNQAGEPLFFWEDLSQAGMIEGTFNTATDANIGTISSTTSPNFSAYLPQAKIGGGNYIYVYSTGDNQGTGLAGNGLNYFGISDPSTINGGNMTSSPGLTVQQAYAIDKKIDDGLPATGNVQADYVTGSTPPMWSPNAPTDSNATCYNTTTNTYSTNASNGGTGLNCALSFKFQ